MSETLERFQSPVPAAVRRAAERAEQLARRDPPPDAPLEPGPEPAAPAPSTTVEPSAPIPDGVPAAAAPEPPPAPAAPPADDWERRYRTLQGKYDAEVPRLQGQIEGLTALIGELQSSLRAPPAPAAVAPEEKTSRGGEIPVADVEQFGDDMIQASRRWARAEVQTELESLRGELRELKGGTQELRHQSLVQRISAAFDADPQLGTRWRSLNTDPEFVGWLQHVDPFSGRKRQDLLTEAHGRGDVNRLMSFFRTFLAEHTAVQVPVPTPAAAPAATPPVSLESLAAPGRPTGVTGPVGAPAKRIWTQASIKKFYSDRSTGKFQGREPEAQALERDLFDAAKEGRIRS